ncbi:MAG: hypothetical protein L6Q97_12150, partial [Thermoanaerobaculia bacterium]|nr:hypothetical protein [Thermoanaerobaculia bacterium]
EGFRGFRSQMFMVLVVFKPVAYGSSAALFSAFSTAHCPLPLPQAPTVPAPLRVGWNDSIPEVFPALSPAAVAAG